MEYLKQHYREEIVFGDMAKQIGISYSYMRKLVYEQTGSSMIDFVNQLRIEQAKELLLDSGLTIKQIAAEVGYANVQSFNRFFSASMKACRRAATSQRRVRVLRSP
ncbi:helix-turn-helix domain-containing protein [Paenibacillus rhizoplanae]